MKKSNIFITFLLVFGLILAITPDVYAERISHASVHLAQKGIKYYKEGDLSSAVHELSKALSVDPRNNEAREYLQKMGFEGGIYGYNKSTASQISSLSQKNYIFQNKIVGLKNKNTEQNIANNQLKGENEALNLRVQQKDDEIDHMNVKIKLTQNEFKKQTSLDKKRIAELNAETRDQKDQIQSLDRIAEQVIDKNVILNEHHVNSIAKKDGKISHLHEEVKYVKNDLLDEMLDYEDKLSARERNYNENVSMLRKRVKHLKDTIGKDNLKQQAEIMELSSLLKERNREVSELEDEVLIRDLEIAKKDKMLYGRDKLAYARPQPRSPKYVEEMLSGETRNEILKKTQLLKQRDRDITRLKEKLVAALKQIDTLEKDARKKDGAKILALKKEIEDIKSQFAEKENYLREKDSDYTMLEERFEDAQQRLTFVQRIIEEKDDQIQELEGEIVQIKNQCSEK